MITVATLRAAGLSNEQIIRVLEIEHSERLAARKEQNRINQRNYRLRKQVSADAADAADVADNKEGPRTPIETTSSSGSSRELPSEAAAKAAAPVYADSRHELWGEGIPILIQLGLTDRAARSNIGRWLKNAHDDAQSVLGAIQRARDNRVIDPVAWVTQAIAGKTNGHRISSHRTNSASVAGQSNADAILAGMGRIAARMSSAGPAAEPEDGSIQPSLDFAGKRSPLRP